MTNLLKANFARLWLTRSFWVCVILSAACSLTNSFSTGSSVSIGRSMASETANVLFFASIFAALFLGTDYSDGTLRNKVIAGAKRIDIYFANLTTVIAGSLIMTAAAMLTAAAGGLVSGSSLGMSAGELLLNGAVAIGATAAMSAVFTLIGMVVSSKSAIAVFTISVSFAMMIVSLIIEETLFCPEYITEQTISEDGTSSVISETRNPQYIEGTERDILTLIYDILPSGQATQLIMGELHEPALLPLYSAGVIAAATAAGGLIFRRKDLK